MNAVDVASTRSIDVLDLILVGNRAALEVDHVVPVEAGGDLLLPRRVREQIAGELLDRELVEGQVAVEGARSPSRATATCRAALSMW